MNFCFTFSVILRQPHIRKFPIDVKKVLLQPHIKHVPREYSVYIRYSNCIKYSNCKISQYLLYLTMMIFYLFLQRLESTTARGHVSVLEIYGDQNNILVKSIILKSIDIGLFIWFSLTMKSLLLMEKERFVKGGIRPSLILI